tara:strand:+ start:6417 stop:7082 length:666 start_codon:yes stop_codon:yes gene_type:complete
MANKKVKFKFTMQGVEGDDDTTNVPSPEWVRRNKYKPWFEAIVRDSWATFISSFNEALQNQYVVRAEQKLTRSTNTTNNYEERNVYRRAHKIEGSERGTTEDVITTNLKGVVSGLLLESMVCKLEFDGTNITILSPMNNNHYKKIISNLSGQPGLKTYYLSKFLHKEFSFTSSGRNAWGFMTEGFKKNGAAYNLAMQEMNIALARKEKEGKRGSYKKSRKK